MAWHLLYIPCRERVRPLEIKTMTYILWAVKPGEPFWAEEIILATSEWRFIEKAKAEALARGFTRLRVLKHSAGDKPDFSSALRRAHFR